MEGRNVCLLKDDSPFGSLFLPSVLPYSLLPFFLFPGPLTRRLSHFVGTRLWPGSTLTQSQKSLARTFSQDESSAVSPVRLCWGFFAWGRPAACCLHASRIFSSLASAFIANKQIAFIVYVLDLMEDIPHTRTHTQLMSWGFLESEKWGSCRGFIHVSDTLRALISPLLGS